MNKNIWIIANWKSNQTIVEALDWISKVGPKIDPSTHSINSGQASSGLKVVVCPTFTAIEEVKKAIMVGNYPIMVGAQDLSPYPEGAYTGEEAASILKQFVDLAIIGHSERRQNFGETDEVVAKKAKQALEQDIIPLVCVQGKQTPVPEGVRLIAYEPIFAIGTGNPDTSQNASAVAQFFRESYTPPGGLEVLYGGSVTDENVKGFVQQESINGVLVGGASLSGEEFLKIVEATYAIR